MTLQAWVCEQGHVMYPRHPRCRVCQSTVDTPVELTDRIGEVITWTVSTATPPGVRSPNPIAIVRFETDAGPVSVIGGLTTDEIAIGDSVEAVHVERLRDPEAGIRYPASQSWDGYRFRPVVDR